MNDIKVSDEFQAGRIFKAAFWSQINKGVKLTHTYTKPFHIFFLYFNLMLRVGTYHDQKLSDELQASVLFHKFA